MSNQHRNTNYIYATSLPSQQELSDYGSNLGKKNNIKKYLGEKNGC